VISNDANSKTQNHFTEKRFLAVDSNFLELFDYEMKKGDAATCLQKTHSIVLTETTAKKYFGNIDPVGKYLVLEIIWGHLRAGSFRYRGTTGQRHFA
jgi:putative ABC transport system permease protein